MEFVPGFLQGITRVLISHPFDYVRLYLQTNSSDSITDFFKKNSYRDLYRGVSIPLLTVPIERAIQLRCYENLNGYTNPFISGAVCGVVSSCVSLPSQYVSNNYILQKKDTQKRSRDTFQERGKKTHTWLYEYTSNRSFEHGSFRPFKQTNPKH